MTRRCPVMRSPCSAHSSSIRLWLELTDSAMRRLSLRSRSVLGFIGKRSRPVHRRELEAERQSDGIGLLTAGALVVTVARPGLLEPEALIERDRRCVVGGDLE